MTKRYLGAAAVALTMLWYITAMPTDEDATKANKESSSTASAMRVVRDQETGELRAATAKEAADFRRQEANAQKRMNPEYAEAAGVVRDTDRGARAMVVDVSRLESVTATVNADGTVTLRHGDHEIPAVNAELPEE